MLVGERIYLRPLERKDLSDRVLWINDQENIQTLTFDWPTSLAKTEAWFNTTLTDSSKYHFSIVEKNTDRLIGMTGFVEVNRIHLRGQLYITIGDKSYRGKRIPDDVISLLLEFAFEELGLKRVYLYTLPNNDRSRHVYKRNGFSFEGILRNHCFTRGKLQNLHVQSILAEEWSAEVKKSNSDRSRES